MIYVYRDGKMVVKGEWTRPRPSFPAPSVSRMEPFESPVTGKTISTWRERDADMRAANAFDARDLGPNHTWRRGRQAQEREADSVRRTESIWRDPPKPPAKRPPVKRA